MLQSDGEPAWQDKTHNASKDKKHLTGINKEGTNEISLYQFFKKNRWGEITSTPTNQREQADGEVDDYRKK